MPFAEPLTVAKTLTTIKEVAVDPDGALESRCLCRCCWSPHFVRLGLVTHAHCGCTSQWLRVRAHAMIGAATRRVQSAARSRSRARSRRAAHRGVTRWREPASPSSRLQTWHYNRTSRLQTCSIQTTLFGYPMAYLRRPPRARGERPFCLMRVSSEHERARLSQRLAHYPTVALRAHP